MSLMLCDDHLLLLETLASALTARGQEVVAIVTHPAEAVSAAVELHPDVCLLDVYFPDGDGIEVAREIAHRAPATKVLMLSASSDPAVVRKAFDAGALGFVQKDDDIDAILSALEQVARDEVALQPRLLRAVMQPTSGETQRRPAPAEHWLTAREREVLLRLVAGDSTAVIATRLGMATSTTRTHIQNVLVKLGVHTRLQAVALATSRNLVERLGNVDGADRSAGSGNDPVGRRPVPH